MNGEEVICLDNFFTGTKSNVIKWINNPRFELIRHDITKPTLLKLINIALFVLTTNTLSI